MHADLMWAAAAAPGRVRRSVPASRSPGKRRRQAVVAVPRETAGPLRVAGARGTEGPLPIGNVRVPQGVRRSSRASARLCHNIGVMCIGQCVATPGGAAQEIAGRLAGSVTSAALGTVRDDGTASLVVRNRPLCSGRGGQRHAQWGQPVERFCAALGQERGAAAPLPGGDRLNGQEIPDERGAALHAPARRDRATPLHALAIHRLFQRGPAQSAAPVYLASTTDGREGTGASPPARLAC